MERILPTLDIEGTTFIVDVGSQELREKDDPYNVISFMEMTDRASHYEFRYSTETKNRDDFDGKLVYIPTMFELDPEGMKAHFHPDKELAQLKGMTDYDMIVDQALVLERLGGKLPVLEIAGQQFYVNIPTGTLQPKEKSGSEGIRFSDMEDYMAEDWSTFLFPYNPKTQEFVPLEFSEIQAIPVGLIAVEIPNEIALDPFGFARQHDLDARLLFRQHPPQKIIQAKIVPWKDTAIDKIIKNNIRVKHLMQPAKQQKKKKAHKKSKGL